MATYARRICRSLEGCRFRLSIGLDLFEEGFCLDFFGFLIALPFLDRWRYEPHEIMETWGVKYFERTIHFNWGSRCKIVSLPWDYDHIKHEVQKPDGIWVPYVGSWEVGETRAHGFGGKEPDGRWQETYDYTYELKSGEVQHRKATVHVERREWRQKWLKWCPLFALRRQSIDVTFDDEVGERTGSWKGGTIGCGWEMQKGETPLQTLRRMESERQFK